MKTYTKTQTLIECAVLAALGTVLAQIKLFRMPSGGSVTLMSMLPFIVIAIRHGFKWGLMSGAVNVILQIALGGFYAPPAGTVIAFIGAVLLDYVVPYMGLAFAGPIAQPFFKAKPHEMALGEDGEMHSYPESAMSSKGRRLIGCVIATFAVCLLRFVSTTLSGILIWSSLADGLWSAVIYSVGYSASYMLLESFLTISGAALISRYI